jgi:hypothetical protein
MFSGAFAEGTISCEGFGTSCAEGDVSCGGVSTSCAEGDVSVSEYACITIKKDSKTLIISTFLYDETFPIINYKL